MRRRKSEPDRTAPLLPLIQVETWFSALTRRQLRRGVHRSVAELEAALVAFAARGNNTAHPFRWTKSADEILQSVKRLVCTLLTHDTSLRLTIGLLSSVTRVQGAADA
jgi:hypothetical protein